MCSDHIRKKTNLASKKSRIPDKSRKFSSMNSKVYIGLSLRLKRNKGNSRNPVV